MSIEIPSGGLTVCGGFYFKTKNSPSTIIFTARRTIIYYGIHRENQLLKACKIFFINTLHGSDNIVGDVNRSQSKQNVLLDFS